MNQNKISQPLSTRQIQRFTVPTRYNCFRKKKEKKTKAKKFVKICEDSIQKQCYVIALLFDELFENKSLGTAQNI